MKRDPISRKSVRHCLIAIFCLCIGIAVAADPGFDGTYREQAESHRHDSLTLRIALPKSSFFLGELIPLTFQFEDTKNTGKYQAWTGTYDRSGRIPLTFVVDGPAGSYCDPLAAYFASRFGIGGGLGNDAKLGRHEQVFHLNEWIRFDRPGKYRFYAISSRVSWTSDNVSHGVELVSPVVSIEIRPSTAAELESTFRDAVAASTAANLRHHYDAAVYEALSRLRYLDTNTSRRHLRGLLGGVEGAHSLAMFGLIGTRETDATIALLEEGIAAPEIAITTHYFDALAHLRRSRENRKRKEEEPPGSPPAAKGTLKTVWFMPDHYGDRADWKKLVGAFDRKTGRAQAVCASSLFSLIKNDRQQDQYEAEARAKGGHYLRPDQERLDHTAVLPKIRVPLAEAFLEMTHDEQERLLRDSWELIRCPELLPPLKRIVDSPAKWPDQSFYSGLQSLAVLRLSELDPAVGKPLILEDVRRKEPRYSLEILCSLPVDDLKKELPLLASHFSAKEGVDTDKIAGMIAHIGDDSIYGAVKRHYVKSEGRWVCITQRHCLAYFIKVRRAEGLDLAFRALTFRGKEHTHCYSSVASDVLALQYGPDVEQRMLKVLRAESEPDVITDLTRVLLKNGTEAVIDPLLDVVERLSSKAIHEDYSYDTEAGARRHVVQGLIHAGAERADWAEQARWKLAPKQRSRLEACLASEQEKKEFKSFFKAE
jgi:hypothetical protein